MGDLDINENISHSAAYNLSRYCVGEPIPPQKYDTASIVLYIILCSLFCALAFIGNVLVLIVIVWDPHISKRKQNLYLFSLAVADAMLALFVVPFTLANELLGYWPFGDAYCLVYLFIDVSLTTVSIWNIVFIGLDRYISIKYPVFYRKHRSPTKTGIVIASIWLFSIFTSLIPHMAGYSKLLQPGKCFIIDKQWYIIVSASLTFYIPTAVLLPIYSGIFVIGRRLHARKRGSTSSVTSMRQWQSVARKSSSPNSSENFPSDTSNDSSSHGSKVTKTWFRFFKHKRSASKQAHVNQNCSDAVADCNENELKPNANGDLKTNDTPLPVDSLPVKEKTGKANENGLVLYNSCAHNQGKAIICPSQVNTDARKNSDERESNSAATVNTVSSQFNSAATKRHSEDKHEQNYLIRKASSFSKLSYQISAVPKKSKLKMSRRELRFVLIILVVTGCFLLCWSPFFLAYLLYGICGVSCCIDPTMFKVFFWLGYLNSGVNPILYTALNQEYRRAFKRLGRCFKATT